ncbi:hypothetical protein MYMAC_006969 [Corallococcus macrosporus DSM 14697]|uniref:Uncharacterized protein n=1 Tax=Corallococcus macrosporus DSM 14697 TaxID=1189310 RepID=A0A286NVW6_9BACT|nr:hypothetical protein MYMAC_006969 [Corallococcus macrosporus DSM 14697]
MQLGSDSLGEEAQAVPALLPEGGRPSTFDAPKARLPRCRKALSNVGDDFA